MERLNERLAEKRVRLRESTHKKIRMLMIKRDLKTIDKCIRFLYDKYKSLCLKRRDERLEREKSEDESYTNENYWGF